MVALLCCSVMSGASSQDLLMMLLGLLMSLRCRCQSLLMALLGRCMSCRCGCLGLLMSGCGCTACVVHCGGGRRGCVGDGIPKIGSRIGTPRHPRKLRDTSRVRIPTCCHICQIRVICEHVGRAAGLASLFYGRLIAWRIPATWRTRSRQQWDVWGCERTLMDKTEHVVDWPHDRSEEPIDQADDSVNGPDEYPLDGQPDALEHFDDSLPNIPEIRS